MTSRKVFRRTAGEDAALQPPPRKPKPRNQHDKLEVWLAYQAVRGQRGKVRALAAHFELSPRRIQQIGNGPRPSKPAAKSVARSAAAKKERNANEAPRPPDQIDFLEFLDKALERLHAMARQLAKDMAHNQPRQLDLIGHGPPGAQLQAQIAELRRVITKKINTIKTTK